VNLVNNIFIYFIYLYICRDRGYHNLGLFHETKKFLSSHFEMKDMGEASYVIGIKIFLNRSQGLLGLSHKAYINKVLERFRMEKCSSSPVPIQKGDKFSLTQCPRNDLE